MADNKKYSLEEEMKKFGLQLTNMTAAITDKAKKSLGLLQIQTYELIVKKAQEKIKNDATRKIYLENLGKINDSDTVYAVYLKKGAEWIEDDVKPHSMIPGLVNGPKSKVSKKGHRYNIIPFNHNKPDNQNSRSQMQLKNIVSQELRGLGLHKTIKIKGKPIIGKAASIDLWGEGIPVSKQGRSLLQGLTIYQREVKMKNGKSKIARDIMTFRVVSENSAPGSWQHPGSQGKHIFEEVSREVEKLWNDITKDIIDNIKIDLDDV
jgi:hypothetical protein